MLEGLRRGLSRFVEKITKVELDPKKLQPIVDELKITLLENDVAFQVAEEIGQELVEELTGVKVGRTSDRKAFVKEALRRAVLRTLSKGGHVDLEELVKAKRAQGGPFVILFVGFNGSGKTTTIAKMAKMLRDRGLKVVLACSDTFRAGAIEQLEDCLLYTSPSPRDRG